MQQDTKIQYTKDQYFSVYKHCSYYWNSLNREIHCSETIRNTENKSMNAERISWTVGFSMALLLGFSIAIIIFIM